MVVCVVCELVFSSNFFCTMVISEYILIVSINCLFFFSCICTRKIILKNKEKKIGFRFASQDKITTNVYKNDLNSSFNQCSIFFLIEIAFFSLLFSHHYFFLFLSNCLYLCLQFSFL